MCSQYVVPLLAPLSQLPDLLSHQAPSVSCCPHEAPPTTGSCTSMTYSLESFSRYHYVLSLLQMFVDMLYLSDKMSLSTL